MIQQKTGKFVVLAAALLLFSGGVRAQDTLEEEAPKERVPTAKIASKAASGFTLPTAVVLEVDQETDVGPALRTAAGAALADRSIEVRGDGEVTLEIEFDVAGDPGKGPRVSGLGDRPRSDREIYSGNFDPYTGESYLDETDFGVAIDIGKRKTSMTGINYALYARLYTLTGEVLWSGTALAELHSADPNVVARAMTRALLADFGNTIAAKDVELNLGR